MALAPCFKLWAFSVKTVMGVFFPLYFGTILQPQTSMLGTEPWGGEARKGLKEEVVDSVALTQAHLP
jgi:hypothetical protein